ncbi:MAG: imidazoleglycerol-phosphate dehydratase HisB [Bacteroidia bacterium]|nr:imidazoleglycerol-phosphate dehydratase HisB [Bacteroidia bacterium]MCX7764724.1 imidazoleglycerol-phosphate dehydratase HisB [Bacteroidia bacterium]MDW8057370.1 imidazoleglycerol-phosphate dehydratase HisB [Bacteroidia bacterium]
MRRYLFIDRDGTLIEEPPDTQQVDSCERLRLLPYVISTLRWAQKVGGYRLVMITNQDGLGTPSFPEKNFWSVQNLLIDIFSSEGVSWYAIHIDRSKESAPSPYRKPSPLFLLPYIESGIDRERSFVIGDRRTDMLLAQRIGLRGLWLPNPLHQRDPSLPNAVLVKDWRDIQFFLRSRLFFIEVERQTKETHIHLQMTLYGSGAVEVQTGIGFFDHMLTLLAFHAGWDFRLRAVGDLHVDVHHTIEDVAIVIGEALRRLLSDKRGLHRYGQAIQEQLLLPMDEALAFVAVDLSGRGLIKWNASFSEAPGNISPTLWRHFFETLAREAGITLHIWVRGKEAHHMIEAVFKGVGRALKAALQREEEDLILPSTKGAL